MKGCQNQKLVCFGIQIILRSNLRINYLVSVDVWKMAKRDSHFENYFNNRQRCTRTIHFQPCISISTLSVIWRDIRRAIVKSIYRHWSAIHPSNGFIHTILLPSFPPSSFKIVPQQKIRLPRLRLQQYEKIYIYLRFHNFATVMRGRYPDFKGRQQYPGHCVRVVPSPADQRSTCLSFTNSR